MVQWYLLGLCFERSPNISSGAAAEKLSSDAKIR
jgi:hypothetical protein